MLGFPKSFDIDGFSDLAFDELDEPSVESRADDRSSERELVETEPGARFTPRFGEPATELWYLFYKSCRAAHKGC